MAEGDLAKSEDFGRRALEAADHGAPENSTELLSSLNHLALVLSARGKYTEAADLAARASVVATAFFGPVSREHADVQNVLAQIAKFRGNLADAEMRAREAVQTYEKAAGPEHPLTLMSRRILAGILREQGKYKAARELLDDLLASLETTGPDRPDAASVIRELAALEFSQKHYERASGLYHRVFEIDLRLFGASDPRTRFDLNDIGSAEFGRHHLHEAESLFLRAMADKNDADVRDAILKGNLAQVYQAEKQYDQAATFYRAAVNQFERNGRSEDPRLGSILAGYASLLRATGDYAQAEKLQAHATAIQVRGVLAREGHSS